MTSGNGGGTNGSGNGHDPDHHDNENEDDKIVPFLTLAERDRLRKQAEKEVRRKMARAEPLINLPPVTKTLLFLIIGIHITVQLLPDNVQAFTFETFSFFPGVYTGALPFSLNAFITPFTHMLLHGSWLHIIMNAFMLAAFGSGIERWIGGKRMMIIFISCGLFGIAAHFIINPFSLYPVVGASGGLSGLFAVAIVMMNRGQHGLGGSRNMTPVILLILAITVIFGMMGSPDGNMIAWAAHVGGFLGGFLMIKLMRL